MHRLGDGVGGFNGQHRHCFLGCHQIARGQARLVEVAHLAHPVVVEHLAEIAGAVVVEDDHHEVAGLEAGLHL